MIYSYKLKLLFIKALRVMGVTGKKIYVYNTFSFLYLVKINQ